MIQSKLALIKNFSTNTKDFLFNYNYYPLILLSSLIIFLSLWDNDVYCLIINSGETLAHFSKINFLVVVLSQCGYFAKCYLGGNQQFSIRETSGDET